MASSKAPKHDFAPAWLKIPEHSNQKTSGAKSCEHAETLGHYGYPRRREDVMPHHRPFDYPYGGSVARPRNFDQVFDDPHFSKQLRGHPLEEEFYSNGYYGGAYPPQAYRPAFSPHPAGRFHPNLGGCPPYPYAYDPMFSERSPVRAGTPRRVQRPEVKDARPKADKPAGPEADKGENRERDQEKPVDSPPLDDDFPCLNGEPERTEEKQEKCKPFAGVWDKNSLEKITNNSRIAGKENRNNCVREVKHNTNIYKALVPSKGKVGVKRSNKDGAKLGIISNRDMNSNSSPKNNKDCSLEAGTAPMDILNTRTVTQPRTLGDKKSDFLRALKQDNDLNSTTRPTSRQCLENGVDANTELSDGFVELDLSGGGGEGEAGLLSSSLEAEQRLLREMGWSEDDEQKPITEEEMREIQQLQKQIKQLKEQKNGFKRTLPKTWSPQHVQSYGAGTWHDDSCSDTDSDS